jgi:hypothetical protein
MRHAERQSFRLSLASPLGRSPYCRRSLPLSTLREARASLRGRRQVASRWVAKAGRCNLYRALDSARRPRAGRYAQSSEPRPRGTSLAGGELGDPVCGYLAADATISSRLQRNSPSSAHMRCIITPSLRGTATVVRRRPRRLAMAMPQAFSPDHRATRVSRACAGVTSPSKTARFPRRGGRRWQRLFELVLPDVSPGRLLSAATH